VPVSLHPRLDGDTSTARLPTPRRSGTPTTTHRPAPGPSHPDRPPVQRGELRSHAFNSFRRAANSDRASRSRAARHLRENLHVDPPPARPTCLPAHLLGHFTQAHSLSSWKEQSTPRPSTVNYQTGHQRCDDRLRYESASGSPATGRRSDATEKTGKHWRIAELGPAWISAIGTLLAALVAVQASSWSRCHTRSRKPRPHQQYGSGQQHNGVRIAGLLAYHSIIGRHHTQPGTLVTVDTGTTVLLHLIWTWPMDRARPERKSSYRVE